MAIRLVPWLVCTTGALLSLGPAPADDRTQTQHEPDARRPTATSKGALVLHLDEVKLSRFNLLEVHATLTNHSEQRAKVWLGALNHQLDGSCRIWRKGIDGSYRQTLVPRVRVTPDLRAWKILAPGESASLHRSYGGAKRLEYSVLVLDERYTWWGRAKGDGENLTPGEYVVDAVMDVGVYAPTEETDYAKLGTVTVWSSNKLWVTVE